MKLIRLTTGEKREVSVWISPMAVQIINQKIGAKYKALILASGQAVPVWEEAEHIAKLINEQLEGAD